MLISKKGRSPKFSHSHDKRQDKRAEHSWGGRHSSAGSALSCGHEIEGSNLRSASKTIVLELALCIPSDGIKLQSSGGHYSGCRNVQTCRTQWTG